ncbi:MAG: GrpB family protein, partial [Chloroflexi bacterium]|nr:GrpB family protein [Chloroflexota bacterium]
MATKPDSTDGTGFPGRAVSLSPIDIVDYDASWPSLYEEERARIQEAIGAWLVDIQHVGSTAVPGLAAKPIIDIAVALRSRADGERCIAPLEALGY